MSLNYENITPSRSAKKYAWTGGFHRAELSTWRTGVPAAPNAKKQSIKSLMFFPSDAQASLGG